jgi:hypothetical protein
MEIKSPRTARRSKITKKRAHYVSSSAETHLLCNARINIELGTGYSYLRMFRGYHQNLPRRFQNGTSEYHSDLLWDGRSEVEYRWGRDFPHPNRPALRPTQPPVQGYWVSFPAVQRRERGVDHQTPASAKVIEKGTAIELSPLWALMACYWLNVTFIFTT